MKFGLMYEIGMPKPWYPGQEQEKYWQVMAQIQYAEEMGFDYTWAVDTTVWKSSPIVRPRKFSLPQRTLSNQ